MEIISFNEYDKIIQKYNYILEELKKIIIESGEALEGNCFYCNGTFDRFDEFISKQLNLYSLARICNNIMEIGFNAGHSSLLFLISNPNCRLVIFDNLSHKYTFPCYNYLNNEFNNRITLIAGDSKMSLPSYIYNHPDKKFDMIHIDGDHSYHGANLDFFHSKQMSIPLKTYIVWDDILFNQLHTLWYGYIRDKHVINFNEVISNNYHIIGIIQ